MISLTWSLCYVLYRHVTKQAYGLPFLVCYQWLILLVLYLTNEWQFVPLGVSADLIIFLFIVIFTFAYNISSKVSFCIEVPRLGLIFVFYAVAFFAIVLSIYRFYAVLGMGHVYDAMSLRGVLSDDTGEKVGFGIGYVYPLGVSAWFLARIRNDVYIKYIFGVLIFVLSLMTTSKIFVLMYFMFLVPVGYSISRPKFLHVVAIALTSLLVFSLMHIALEKLINPEQGILYSLYTTFSTYLLGGLAGFQMYESGYAYFPSNVVWKPVGDFVPWLIDVPSSAILPWIDVGYWYTNTYTAFAYWLDGFGLVGFIGFVFALGFFGKQLSDSKHVFGLLLERVFLFSLLIVYHQDFFLSSIKVWIGFVFFGCLAVIFSDKNSKVIHG